MRHNLHLRGYRFALRPVDESDAELIVTLRNDPAVAPYLNAGAITTAMQREWLTRYFSQPDDYYFVVVDQVTGTDEGLVGLYNVDRGAQTAEWGRWVVRAPTGAVESALLVYRCGFEQLDMQMIYCRTLAENRHVVSFHDSSGAHRHSMPVHLLVDGERRLAIEHRVDISDWPAVEQRLSGIAARLAGSKRRQ